MSPRLPDPRVRLQLVETAARVLSTEGRRAVTARRLATEVGASTQAVYTHFGGMDELLAEIWREGFRRFAAALDEPALTDDTVADWMAQGWSYRRFGLRDEHLYRVMFGEGVIAFREGDPADLDAAAGTFVSLLTRLERNQASGRWQIPDVFTTGELVWEVVHGHVLVELSGYFEGLGRDPEVTYTEGLRRLALSYGDDADLVETSLRKARRRARAADRN
jgi:AcrR family transcriptional regulator